MRAAAHTEAAKLLGMIGASWMSQVVCVAAELRVADLLVGLGGRERTKAEFATLLASSGFKLARFIRTAFDHCMIEGVRE